MGANKIREVPDTIGSLAMLQALNLCDNRIEKLPSSIARLHNLKTLSLHRNGIRTLPPELISLKNLTELSLRENPLVERFVQGKQFSLLITIQDQENVRRKISTNFLNLFLQRSFNDANKFKGNVSSNCKIKCNSIRTPISTSNPHRVSQQLQLLRQSEL
jgi:hypothetical protein